MSTILEATTDVYGRVQSVKGLRSVPLLDPSPAIEAVRQWVYEPMVINGRLRSVTFTVTITFEAAEMIYLTGRIDGKWGWKMGDVICPFFSMSEKTIANNGASQF